MALYTPSQLLTVLKQDMGIRNIPLPVKDSDLYDRLTNSALKEFSLRSPRVETFLLNNNERVTNDDFTNRRALKYVIPAHYYLGCEIINILRVDIARPSGYSDLAVTPGLWAGPDAILESIADIRSVAGMGAAMGKALTFRYAAPDMLYIYNGWQSGIYEIELAMTHDSSLITIQPTQMSSFRKLALLDLEEYLYNQLKMIENLDVGVGNIQLKIDTWADAAAKKEDLLEKWDEDSSLDVDSMFLF